MLGSQRAKLQGLLESKVCLPASEGQQIPRPAEPRSHGPSACTQLAHLPFLLEDQ